MTNWKQRLLLPLALIMLVSVLASTAGTVNAAPAGKPAPAPVAQNCEHFQNTGFSVCGRLLEYWYANGGLPVFGYPIGPEVSGIQWFERNRLELHPENNRPYDVLLGRLGAEALNNTPHRRAPVNSGVDEGLCIYFDETGHNLCGDFYGFWAAYGVEVDGQPGIDFADSVALWGFPLTEAFMQNGRMTQYFERAILREFPENNPPYTVQGDLLGVQRKPR